MRWEDQRVVDRVRGSDPVRKVRLLVGISRALVRVHVGRDESGLFSPAASDIVFWQERQIVRPALGLHGFLPEIGDC
jgi:hypothetical protein